MVKNRRSESGQTDCICSSDKGYPCCRSLLEQKASALTAEQLMRSRYCAFVHKDSQYLLATWHPKTRPVELDLTNDQTRWLGLEVKAHQQFDESHAEVEFVARFKEGGGPAQRLHERSRFERLDEKWFYLDGDFKL